MDSRRQGRELRLRLPTRAQGLINNVHEQLKRELLKLFPIGQVFLGAPDPQNRGRRKAEEAKQ